MYGVGIYNRLVTLKNRFENAFSQIEVQLKRRYDLIPNLVETVKGYIKHERETLEAVINARNQAVGGLAAGGHQAGRSGRDAGPGRRGANAQRARWADCSLLAEAYPDLKANQNMAQLTEELTSTENRVAFARQAYNDSAHGRTTLTVKRSRPSCSPTYLGHGSATRSSWNSTAKTIAEAPKVSF